jgi:glycosyltransferase involved in cell wall biosynthesis
MKILHILDEKWDSALTAYGLSAASALAARGHDVWVTARIGSFAESSALRRGLPYAPLRGFASLRRFVGRKAFDVVNTHTGSSHVLGLSSVLGRRIALVRSQGDARTLRRRWGQSLVYRRTDAVLAASRLLARPYEKVYPDLKGRVMTVYPGVAVPSLHPEPAAPLRVALVGRLDPVKGHAVFLEAIARLKDRLIDEQFLIVGEEKNVRREDLERRVRDLGIVRWVGFLGRLEHLGEFMFGCHAGVVASVGSEALSRVTLEWMARGRPVVATDVGGLSDLVVHGANGLLVKPQDPSALAEALWWILSNTDWRRAMGRGAWRTARERFGWERFADETEQAYRVALWRRRRDFA